ncbi:MAG: polysaccharide deacetylase family protein, partial [Novosphingobium sp.]
MTTIYITIDTEYSAGFFARDGADARTANFDASIAGRTRDGQAGIEYQMDIFDAHGLKAVFFVDPMPALIWGVEAIADVVGPIVARGHDVQLHVHTEWLAFAGAANPLGSRTGRNIKDFTRDEQVLLLGYAANALQQAGAPRPVAFRAGNYGANDDTLRALASLGISYDSSHCPALAGEGECGISLGADDREPMEYCGVIEVPVGSIAAHRNRQRHAQLTALSGQ